MYPISIHPQSFQTKPSNNEIRQISSQIGNYSVFASINDISVAVHNGQTIVLSHFKDGNRKLGFFRESKLVGIDFDKSDIDSQILDEAIIVYRTFSHTAANPRHRAIYELADTITDYEVYSSTVAAFMQTFEERGILPDRSCKDCSRLFFGSTSDCIVKSAATNFFVPISLPKKIKSRERLDVPPNMSFADLNRLIYQKSPRYYRGVIHPILKEIDADMYNSNQSRYTRVWFNTIKLLNIPEYDIPLVRHTMLKQIDNNPDFHDWSYIPENVVDSAIDWWEKKND